MIDKTGNTLDNVSDDYFDLSEVTQTKKFDCFLCPRALICKFKKHEKDHKYCLIQTHIKPRVRLCDSSYKCNQCSFHFPPLMYGCFELDTTFKLLKRVKEPKKSKLDSFFK